MKDIANQLRSMIAKVEPRLLQMRTDDLGARPAASEWSKKEILGHLIDSAANNHQRFVRAASGAAADYPPYAQEDWVRIQRYNERPWDSLVSLWAAYNHHLIHVIDSIPADARYYPCNIGNENPATLEFVVKDYLRHLQLHLEDILDESFRHH